MFSALSRIHFCMLSSGKCQIVHWRQGHKDECRPFAISEQSDDMGDCSRQNQSKPIENRIHCGNVEIERSDPAKPVEISSNGHGFSDSSFGKLPKVDNDVELDHFTDKEEPVSDLKVVSPSISNEDPGVISSNGSSGSASAIDMVNLNISETLQSGYLVPNKIKGSRANIDQPKTTLSPYPLSADSIDNVATQLKSSTIKPSSVHVDAHYGLSTSSASSIDGCNDSSFSEPSTPSSGFWEGTIKLNRVRGAVNDTPSDEAGDVDLLDSETSHNFYDTARTVLPGLDKPGSNVKKMSSDDRQPPVPDINKRKPSTSLASSVEVKKEGFIAQRSSLSSEKSDHLDNGDFSSRNVSTCRDTRETALCRDAKGITFYYSPNSEKSKSQVAGKIVVSQEEKSVEPDGHLSSGAVKHTIDAVKPSEVDSTHLPSTRSSDFPYHSQISKNNSKASVWKVVDQIKSSKFARLNSPGAVSESVGRYSNKVSLLDFCVSGLQCHNLAC